jgi:GDP-mannose 6-dehydrogenase
MTQLLAQRSGLVAGVDFGVCVNPEFLREGSAVDDFEARDAIVIGETDGRDGDLVLSLERGRRLRSVMRCDPATAELLKYLHNAWNALRVGFANEAGALATDLRIDARSALAAFASNATGAMAPGYLAPGAPWGGGCLGKDLEALRDVATRRGVAVPLLDAIGSSNARHAERCVEDIVARGARRVTLIGLAFKAGTADVRDSPFVAIARELAQRVEWLRVYDAEVADEDLDAALRRLRARSLEAALGESDLAVLCHGDRAAREAIRASGVACVELAIPNIAPQPLAPPDVAAA